MHNFTELTCVQLQCLLAGTSCTFFLFNYVVCVLMTRHYVLQSVSVLDPFYVILHYVLQSVSVLDPIYVILMNAREAHLSTAGAHMAYSAYAPLVGRHDTVSSRPHFSCSLSDLYLFYQGTARSITFWWRTS